MRIALVSPYDLAVPGGVNAHVRQLRDQFVARGHEVAIVGPASHEISGWPEQTYVIGRPWPVPASGSVARIAISLRLSGQVKRFLAEHRFDVVHVHEPLMPVLPILFLRFSSAVNVGTFHAAREGGLRLYSYTRRLLKRWFKKLDGKVAVSPPAEHLAARYFPGYYNIIPNGIDLSAYVTPVQPFPELRDGRINILFIGRFEKRKGLKYLLRAYALLQASYPETRLIVVGEGRGRRRYAEAMRAAGYEDVIFTGRVSEEDKLRYLQSADIFCAPNTGMESQGYVLLEAMAAGLPVVASNIEGFAWVVTHGLDGLLFTPKDHGAMAAALAQLIDSPEQRDEIAGNARLRAEDFSWDRIAQRVLSYYERLLYERALSHATAGGPRELEQTSA